MPSGNKSADTEQENRQAEGSEEGSEKTDIKESSKSGKDAPDRDSSATKGGAGTRPPSDS